MPSTDADPYERTPRSSCNQHSKPSVHVSLAGDRSGQGDVGDVSQRFPVRDGARWPRSVAKEPTAGLVDAHGDRWNREGVVSVRVGTPEPEALAEISAGGRGGLSWLKNSSTSSVLRRGNLAVRDRLQLAASRNRTRFTYPRTPGRVATQRATIRSNDLSAKSATQASGILRLDQNDSESLSPISWSSQVVRSKP
jgi:hypothetical protein